METKHTTYQNLSISYGSNIDFPILVKEVFKEEIYKFETQNPSPLIIDCGSNIGMSVLYFKQKYPNAHVIAFEPDPDNFLLLKENVTQNNLSAVELNNVAVSDSNDDATLFFESDKSSTLGNTTSPAWGDRPGFKSISVKAVKLSDFIKDKQIDYLKLDVEGAEKKVFEDIKQYLPSIQELGFEFHHTNIENNNADYQFILDLLTHAGFILDIKHISMDFMPAKYKPWLDTYKPSLSVINARRK